MSAVKRVVILGGGSAGWITAGVIAAEHCAHQKEGLEVVLVESPDVPIIGVGEGTWPSMRNTLRRIGISETQLFKECEASFKQGAKFARWVSGEEDDFYYHPLVIPEAYGEIDLASLWLASGSDKSFADDINFQSHLCEAGLAPKLITTPEYAAIANYAYHLNAGKLGQLLQKHSTEHLGVKHIRANVTHVIAKENGDIHALQTKEAGEVSGDLFIDCSGTASLLLGKYFQTPFRSCVHQLFNDRAIAVQVPYAAPTAPIASHTISTAQSSGWIWDIGLPTRKGIGHVYSSQHANESLAFDELVQYLLKTTDAKTVDGLHYKKLQFNPGHYETFWRNNCVAIGMASGFLEPLEASALVLVELGAGMLADDLPATRDAMEVIAKRYNDRFRYRWQSIIDFLKLHYALSNRRDSAYWRDNVLPETQSPRLQEWLKLWRDQPPCRHDFPQQDEVFASASWQYVLYGMGYKTQPRATKRQSNNENRYQQLLTQNAEFAAKCKNALSSNRSLIEKIHAYGLNTI